jgi:hypothetical protein
VKVLRNFLRWITVHDGISQLLISKRFRPSRASLPNLPSGGWPADIEIGAFLLAVTIGQQSKNSCG